MSEATSDEWVEFPGGELEGRPPRVRCQACRNKVKPASGRAPLCFQCYRAGLEFARALKAAGELNTASAARFQAQLPFEPVNTPRLERLRAERAAVRVSSQSAFVDKRRRAQLEARHALQRIAARLNERRASRNNESKRRMADAVHAAELQLPEAWLSFVVSR
jgi:hypothetical protein